MQLGVIARVLGILLMLFSSTLLPPIIVGLIYQDTTPEPFIYSFLTTFLTGVATWLPTKNKHGDLKVREGFVVVVLFWTVLSLFAALPLYLSLNISITEAIFEAVSGLTTTGATVLTGIDSLPKSALFYRQEIQWLGGMGIIVLAVAVLPMLGIGGMQLYRAEVPGPMKEDKIAPRIAETAKTLWYIYLILTIVCALFYFLAGMDAFDAVAHSFSTISTGGSSTHDASLGYFENIGIDIVAIIFMILAGINFSLHFLAITQKNFWTYFQDIECRNYLVILGIGSVITIGSLLVADIYGSWDESFVAGIFQVVSIATTTGFTTENYAYWPTFLPLFLLLLSFSSGCAGSTAGGMKVIRIVLLFKQASREIKRLIHPNGFFSIKLNGKLVPERVMESIWGFFAAYVIVFLVLILLMMFVGLDQVTAFSSVAACLNNLGPGLGQVSEHYGNLPDSALWILCFAMLLGRLEIFTLIVLVSPHFWKN